MIDFKEIYKSAAEEPMWLGEGYREGSPADVQAILADKIDLNNQVKFAMVGKFSPGKKLYERPLKKDQFSPFDFGDGIELEVDTSKPAELFGGGACKVFFKAHDEFWGVAEKFEDALNSLDDFESAKKAAKDAAKAEYERSSNFDADSAFVLGRGKEGSKPHLKNKRQAVAKKNTEHQRSLSKAASAAEDSLVKARNAALLASGVSESVAKLILNGSFDYYECSLCWFPTVLDLARMFDLRVSVPARVFIDANWNDENGTPDDGSWNRKALAESWNEIGRWDRDRLFDDIRDCRHWDSTHTYKGRFPLVKKDRWNRMLQSFPSGIRQVDVAQFGRMRKDTFVQDGKVIDGKTGNILLRF